MRGATSAWLGLGGGVLLAAVIVACAAPQRPDDKRPAEILSYWMQIRQWRHDAHMDLDPAPTSLNAVLGKGVRDTARTCPDNHAVPKSCEDVCGLADAICDNAEAICNLADQLGKANAWAQDKCTSAKASCRESKQRCCDCGGGG